MHRAAITGMLLLLLTSCSDDSARPLDDARRVEAGSLEAGRPEARTGDGGPRLEQGARIDGAGAGCSIFPADNPWNTDISGLKVHASSASFIASIGATKGLHADFGTVWEGAPNGIPYVMVPAGQPKVTITFDPWGDESDPGPYPIPLNAPIEGGPSSTGDRHVLAVDLSACFLYELANAYPTATGWKATCGAAWDLRSNKLRPIGWTSADAAGLPIFPGLVRHEEVQKGAINHALRFTVNDSQKAYVLPATHYASSNTDPSLPPMGLRVRLKASYDISAFSAQNKVILTAMKKYGMIVADNGSDWFVSGAPDPKWNDDDLAKLSLVKGSDFEVVDTGPIKTSY